jgi:hypothetical protein
VKPVASNRSRLELVTINRSYWFQAESPAEATEWMQAIAKSVEFSINNLETQRNKAGSVRALVGKSAMDKIRSIGGNDRCADCDAEGEISLI